MVVVGNLLSLNSIILFNSSLTFVVVHFVCLGSLALGEKAWHTKSSRLWIRPWKSTATTTRFVLCILNLLNCTKYGKQLITYIVPQVEFNTQCSSQWDALCSWKTSSQIPSPEALPLTDTPLSGHFYDQDLKRGYNDANPSIGDLVQEHGKEDHDAVFPTLNRMWWA